MESIDKRIKNNVKSLRFMEGIVSHDTQALQGSPKEKNVSNSLKDFPKKNQLKKIPKSVQGTGHLEPGNKNIPNKMIPKKSTLRDIIISYQKSKKDFLLKYI